MTEPEMPLPGKTEPTPSAPQATTGNDDPATPSPGEQADAKRSRRWLRWSAAGFLLLAVGSGSFMAWEWQQLGLPLSGERTHAPGSGAETVLAPVSTPGSGPGSGSAVAPAGGAQQHSAADMQRQSAADMQRQIAALQDSVQTLQTRLAVTGPHADLAALSSRLNGVETGLRALDSLPKLPATLLGEVEELRKTQTELKRTSADAATVLRLVERLERAESQIRSLQEQQANAVSLLLAAGQLREAVQRALPYDEEWQVLRVLAENDKEIQSGLDSMTSHRSSGIPARLTLISRFDALAPALLRAELLPDPGSWWQRSLDRLAGLVLIRREDAHAAGGSVAAIVARTEAALAQQDLAGAVQELDALPTAVREQAAPWLRDAQARIQAEQALSAITARLIAAQRARHGGAGQ